MRAPRLAAWVGTRRSGLAPLDVLLLGALAFVFVFVYAGDPARLLGRGPRRCAWVQENRLETFLGWDTGTGFRWIDTFQDPADAFPLGVPISAIDGSSSPIFSADLDDGRLYPGDTLLSATLWGTRRVVPLYGRGPMVPQATGWTFVVLRHGRTHTYHLTIACTPPYGP